MPRPNKLNTATWPWVSFKMPPASFEEWTALADQSRKSRSELMREALEQVGLPYAQTVARLTRDAA